MRTVVERLRQDHDFFMRELAGAVNAAREPAAQDDPPDALAVAERLAEHNRTEEEQLYLWPVALLTQSELDAVCEGTKREIENLPTRFSGRAPR